MGLAYYRLRLDFVVPFSFFVSGVVFGSGFLVFGFADWFWWLADVWFLVFLDVGVAVYLISWLVGFSGLL